MLLPVLGLLSLNESFETIKDAYVIFIFMKWVAWVYLNAAS